jgi:tetratricopeptide (TPR) repeat protein
MKRHILLLAACALLAPTFTQARTPSNDEFPCFTDNLELKAGFRLLYEQKFPEGREKFTAWETENPANPFGQVALAASYLFEEFNYQGVLTSEFFMDDDRFLNGIKGKPDAERMKGFLAAIAKTRELAEVQRRKDPKDAQALFALTLAAGMESDADSILFKKQLDGLKRMKEANEYAKKLLAQRPDAFDAWVAPGSANYIIGSLSAGFRMMLWFGGIHGDKKMGMELVGRTAEKGRYLEPFAKILLALAARREKQNALAEKLLKALTEEYPESPLFVAEYAKVQGRMVPAQMVPAQQRP